MLTARSRAARDLPLTLPLTLIVLAAAGCGLDPGGSGGEPLAATGSALVEYAAVSAHWREDGVLVAWSTFTETDTAGFNVWERPVGAAEFGQANAALIPAQDPDGAYYEFLVWPLDPGDHEFKVEDVDTAGVGSFSPSVICAVFGGDGADRGSAGVCGAAPGAPGGLAVLLGALLLMGVRVVRRRR